MYNEELVELITKEVMNRLKILLEENNRSKKKLLILEHSKDLCPILTGALSDNNFIIDCLDNMGDIENYEGIILQNISNSELTNLSLTIQGSMKEKVAIEAVLKGLNLYAMEKGVEYKKYAATANRVLFNAFKDHQEKLKSYGVNFVGLKVLLSTLKGENVNISPKSERKDKSEVSVQIKDEANKSIKKKLISETELRDLYKDGVREVVIPKKSIVTPLAKDFARINKLLIKFES
ncbi:hypothetical protein [Clostridium sp. UBA6640]|uniref:hypothetical protein n=1 Tax=Clostridium sp. UBA6640 TaxID=1946370 RepID=UPI0025C08148|nr:hypothetical protein [Clostridium sp. UBA6640]